MYKSFLHAEYVNCLVAVWNKTELKFEYMKIFWNMDYLFIAATPRSTLTQSASTC